MERAQEAQAGVARADVIGGDPETERPARCQRRPQPVRILEGLALGELKDHAVWCQAVPAEQSSQPGWAELGCLECPRREIDAEELSGIEPDGAGRQGLDRCVIELERAAS